MIAFRTDNPASDVLRLLAEYRLGPDAGYQGELARLFDGRSGYRRLYYRKGGLTLDGFTEVLLDAGVTVGRATPSDLLDYLDDLLRKQARKRGRKRATASEVDDMLRKAKDVRARLFQCNVCGQKIRGTRQTAVICARCVDRVFEGIASEIAVELGDRVANAVMLTVRDWITPMERKDPVPEEILPLTYQVGEVAHA